MISAEPLALGWLISPIGTADITAVDFNPLQLLLWISIHCRCCCGISIHCRCCCGFQSIADYHCSCCCGISSNADYPFQIRWFKKDRPSRWLFVLCLWLLSVRLKPNLYKSPEPLALSWLKDLISPIGTADISAVDFNPLQMLLWISIHCRLSLQVLLWNFIQCRLSISY
jgi:hypothetical protein